MSVCGLWTIHGYMEVPIKLITAGKCSFFDYLENDTTISAQLQRRFKQP